MVSMGTCRVCHLSVACADPRPPVRRRPRRNCPSRRSPSTSTRAVPYHADLPRPATLLGYEPGAFQTTYANYERFLRELTAKSDRLKVMTLGETPEHRPLYLLAVSTPENLAKLDAVKADMAKLADPRVCSDAEAADIAARSPMVVWLSYSIHGDESAAFEAGMQVLYQLIASDDPKIVDALGKCVVLINPCQNPDGHERFTAWYNAMGHRAAGAVRLRAYPAVGHPGAAQPLSLRHEP